MASEEPAAKPRKGKTPAGVDADPLPRKAPRREASELTGLREEPAPGILQKMRPRLDGLTEELTLDILSRLDFRSLAAARGVCRRLGRIASDASLLGRVSVVQWAEGKIPRGGDFLDLLKEDWDVRPWDEDAEPLFRTNCAQLGSVQMPKDPEAAAGKFLVLLEWLLEGGASPVSLQTPMHSHSDGNVLARLPALLTKHEVELESLACCESRVPALLELFRSQPTIAHLCLPRFVDEEVDEVAKSLSALRHLSVVEPGFEWYNAAEPGLLAALTPQLRSFLCVEVLDLTPVVYGALDVFTVSTMREVAGCQLLFRAVGLVDSEDEEEGLDILTSMGFAVEDFRAEERGGRFLVDGELWDPWHEAFNPVPRPTLDRHAIRDFLTQEARRQREEDGDEEP